MIAEKTLEAKFQAQGGWLFVSTDVLVNYKFYNFGLIPLPLSSASRIRWVQHLFYNCLFVISKKKFKCIPSFLKNCIRTRFLSAVFVFYFHPVDTLYALLLGRKKLCVNHLSQVLIFIEQWSTLINSFPVVYCTTMTAYPARSWPKGPTSTSTQDVRTHI